MRGETETADLEEGTSGMPMATCATVAGGPKTARHMHAWSGVRGEPDEKNLRSEC